jgi:flagellar FliJ protein
MSAFESLALAIEVATRRRDQAEQGVQQAQRALRHAQAQLEQLSSYAQETGERWATAQARTFSAELMRHRHSFMQRLEHAIGLQQGVLADLQQQLQQAQQQRVRQEQRLAALQQLLQRRLTERARAEARREQKQLDDWVSQSHARRLSQRAVHPTGEIG